MTSHAREVSAGFASPEPCKAALSDRKPAPSVHLDPNRVLHDIEHAVRDELLAQPNLRFSSLVVRRLQDGVCLQGFLETDDADFDVCTLAQKVDGVNQVMNRLVVVPSRETVACH